MTAEQRAQAVIRLLSKEEPGAQIARVQGFPSRRCTAGGMSFSGGKQALNGRGAQAEQVEEIERLNADLAERDRVISEITIANRILEKLSGDLS